MRAIDDFAARAQVVVADKDKFKKRPEWAAQGAKLSTREGSKVRVANDYDDANKAQARLQSALEVLPQRYVDSYHVLEEESILCRSSADRAAATVVRKAAHGLSRFKISRKLSHFTRVP